jgi:subtilisin family serine protease
VLDTGITPQHPSFQDPGIPRPPGTAAVQCQFGDASDPRGPLGPPATCNDKLLGAYAFLNTYMQVFDVLPGEFCNQTTRKCSARDADGHGTHTASTAAGSPVGSAPLFGIDRGPISGIAPGASVIGYRVCAEEGCFQSDSVAAVNQAINDGVDVINFSISGGEQPFSDPVELAFLDFYDAGGLANASAGNSGPGAGTAAHGGPWTNTVGASTSPRHFLTALRMSSSNGSTLMAAGSSVTPPIPSDTPVVAAATLEAGNELCTADFPAGSASGKIVLCQGASGRNAKALKVKTAGGVGMILVAPTRVSLFTDNFWVPTVMVRGPSPASDVLAFMANPGVTARWQTGEPTPVRADEMTHFSSRGPLGDFIKPDVTAPGLQILAGTTPTPWPGNPVAGPPGQLFQAISGTSMSSPHAAGVSALIKAAHPDWTPGQIKSAMMTSSVQDVVKNDGVTPADPFDRGAGSIRVDRAVAAPVTFDVSAASYVLSATDPLNRVNLNLPSIDATAMAGELTTTRLMKNVSGRDLKLDAETAAPPGSQIVVSPAKLDLRPNESRTVTISILGKDLARNAQYFGQVTFKARGRGGLPDTVLPVAFFTKQGAVSLSHTCAAASVKQGSSTPCQLKATNTSPAPATTTITVSGAQKGKLEVRNVAPPATATRDGLTWTGTLSAAKAPTITGLVTPGGSPAGYLPLSGFGVAPITGIGDETIANFNVPAFKYGTEEYTQLAVTSNGYAIVGGGSSQDLNFAPPANWPDRARPNNVLAPYWSDLNPAAGGAVRLAVLTDGTTRWLIADWENVPTYSSAAQTRSFQVWIQLGTEGIWFTYGKTGAGDPGSGLAVGAENRDGTSGIRLQAAPIPGPGSDIAVKTAPPVAGGSILLGYDAFGVKPGLYQLVARMTSDVSTGTAAESLNLEVTKKR